MYILGIHGGVTVNQHDASSCIVSENRILAACEEERYIRYKGSAGRLPVQSIRKCLEICSIDITQVDLVVVPGATYPEQKLRVSAWLAHHFGFSPPVLVVHHQLAHLYSLLPLQPPDDSTLISSDAFGDRISGYIASFRNGLITTLCEIPIQSSLGRLYGLLTNFLGYRAGEDEYKVMGMSAFGDPSAYNLSSLCVDVDPLPILCPDIFTSFKQTQDEPYYSDQLNKVISLSRRLPSEPFGSEHFNLAASVQCLYESCFEKVLDYACSLTGNSNLYLAGGTALNSLANYKLRKTLKYKSLTIQPAASDRGLSLGAAIYGLSTYAIASPPLESLSLGTQYSQSSILDTLKRFNLNYTRLSDVKSTLADLLIDGKVIGLLHGRSEYGPRALGNRSILASPTFTDMKQVLNKKIKFRESYRPFACICSLSEADQYFKNPYSAPYMTEIFDAADITKSRFPSIVHNDGTCRVQTVDPENDHFLSSLLQQLQSLGHPPLIINTSFNLSGEPIVETPADAIRSFFSSGLDYLLLEDILLEK